jgi:2,5-dihydroxypyridine 5,6-dioxygenase
MTISIVEMAPAAKMIVEQVLGIKPGEKVCIFTDTERPQSITHLLAASVIAVGAEPVIVTVTPKEVGGIDPPAPAAAAIRSSDVVIAQASYAIVHTDTVRAALKCGARVCDMWGFNEDMMMQGGATADYAKVGELSHRIAKILTPSKKARLTTKDGTDIMLSLEGRQAAVLAAQATQPGQFCAFPDGEAAISPAEGTAEGILVNPFSMEKADIGFLKEGISLEVKGGKVTDITGGAVAKRLLEFLEPLGDSAKNIAELGIGTNPNCRIGVTIREMKKAWGTAHIAIGDSKSIGGKIHSSLHMDMIFLEPTLVVDSRTVLREGKVSI